MRLVSAVLFAWFGSTRVRCSTMAHGLRLPVGTGAGRCFRRGAPTGVDCAGVSGRVSWLNRDITRFGRQRRFVDAAMSWYYAVDGYDALTKSTKLSAQLAGARRLLATPTCRIVTVELKCVVRRVGQHRRLLAERSSQRLFYVVIHHYAKTLSS
jgi:hypothetical protein